MTPERRQQALVLALGLALGLLLYWPHWLHPLSTVPGHPTADCWSHAFGIRWFYNAITELRIPSDGDGLGWPRGGRLWYIDPLGAILGLPFVAIGGVALAYQVELFAQTLLATLGGWCYGKARGGSGWFSAVALATTPTFLAEVHNGILEAGWVGWVPLAGAAALSGRAPSDPALSGPALSGPVRAGIYIGLATIASPYHGISAAIVVGLHLLPHPRQLLRAAAIAALLSMPPLLAIRASLSGEESLEQKAQSGMMDPTLRVNALSWDAFFRPGAYWTVEMKGETVPNYRRTSYLGWVTMLAALWGMGRWLFSRGGRWRALAGVLGALLVVGTGMVLSLGPYLWAGRDFYRDANHHRLRLPLYGILEVSPVNLDHPLRLLGMSSTVLAGLADAGLGRAAPLFALAALAENLLVAPSTWPYASSDLTIPTVYQSIPNDGRALLDLPADRGDSIGTNRYLLWQTLHRHPIPYVLKVSGRGIPSMNPALRTWTGISLAMPMAPGSPGSVDPTADLPAAVEALRDDGLGWVVLHRDLLLDPNKEETYRNAIDPLLGPPREVENTLVWSLDK